MIRHLIIASMFMTTLCAVEQPFIWQQDYAQVSPSGDLRWSPKAYGYEPGATVRYIDYEAGADDADGSKARPWKHHPWDGAFTGSASDGIDTYVFKGGVIYRGQLTAKQGGRADDVVQLCSDPDWGDGPAMLVGSQAVTAWHKGGAHADTPAKDLVYTAEVDWLPRTIWVVKPDGEAIRIPLARTPNWRVEGRDDIKAGWWSWSNKGTHHFKGMMKVGGKKLNFSTDPEHLTADVLKFAKGATVWSEYGWVMGTPYPSRIYEIDNAKGGIAFGSQWADNDASNIVTHCRYYLENSPGFLDDPQGEHWIEKTGEHSARIHLIFPKGLTPENCRVEVGRYKTILKAEQQSHLRVAGLDFRYTNAGWDINKQGTGPAITLRGPFENIEIANCRFIDLGSAVSGGISGEMGSINGLVFRDNDILRADERVINVSSADQWGMADGPFGYVQNVEVLRNRAAYIGMRPSRYGQGHAMDFTVVRTLHAAGNILDMCWGAGIFVYGAKNQQSNDDVPFARILIHQNKVSNGLLNTMDWGAIETWQGGPAYVFNNVVADVRGYWNYNYMGSKGPHRNASFGHAYYLDGAFKNYHFNNIAYSRTRDWTSPYFACSAFQEIHSYQNTFFNNSAYNFAIASRRQAPQAGRDKFLSNVFDGMQQGFRHSDAKGVVEANAKDAGSQGDHFAYDTNAYSRNLFFDVAKMGLFEANGILRDSLDSFSTGLAQHHALASDVGLLLDASPLPKGDEHDFTPGPAVDGMGAKVFVPWSLYGCVAEWNFYPSKADGRIIDEHWYMSENYQGRTGYHNQPLFPLQPASGQGAEVAIDGPLEDWVKGAVGFDGKAYYSLANGPLNEALSYTTNNRGGPKRGQKIEHTVEGAALKNPQVYDSNLLIEVFFKADADGIIIEKMDQSAGYGLRIVGGKGVFTIKSGGSDQAVTTTSSLADGGWHHLIVEADREAKALAAYVDGKPDAKAVGLGAVSLANSSDLFVGGSPDGDGFSGAIDFMRICLGTLADAQTTIDEVCAWQFDGPMLRDFSGKAPQGKGRDAGAIEAH